MVKFRDGKGGGMTTRMIWEVNKNSQINIEIDDKLNFKWPEDEITKKLHVLDASKMLCVHQLSHNSETCDIRLDHIIMFVTIRFIPIYGIA